MARKSLPKKAAPEELVRARFVAFLKKQGCPSYAIRLEYSTGRGRFDVGVCLPDGSLWLLAECKASLKGLSPWLRAQTQLHRYQAELPPVRYFAIVASEGIWCWEAATGRLLPHFPVYPE
ncbi:MAG: type I restriction enzyme HsdR N-terminal domain-containing protein [Bacteroidia bacterium]